MRKLLAVLLTLALLGTLMVSFAAAEELEPITLTVFRGDPGDQPTEDNKIYKLIEEKFGVKFKFEYLAGDLDE
jgi:putative aldouronate transport system substrate-binding protein